MGEVVELAKKREEKRAREEAEAEVAIALYENPWFKIFADQFAEIFALLFTEGSKKEGDTE